MGFTIETGVSAMAVFLQGLLSFFSPCVLPLLPMYIGYLAGGAQVPGEDGKLRYDRRAVMANTFFFVVGISFAFFVLGMGFTALGRFFSGNRALFARIGGILVILLGLYETGFLQSRFLSTQRSLPLRLESLAMSPAVALLFGFVFSFSWTPCVGPALTSVLLLASTASSSAIGFLLIGVYTLGFVLPFLAVGLFTTSLLGFFRRHQKAVAYTAKAGGVLLILMGVMMFTGWMNGVTGYLSGLGTAQTVSSSAAQPSASEQADASQEDIPTQQEAAAEQTAIPAPDFTLVDQNGESHTLSDYRGKVVFLNFWATWCGPCRSEMPDIQALYEERDDIVVLGVANPKTDERPTNQDVSEEEIIEFLSQNGYTYPVAMDRTGEVFAAYGIQAFPTTFMIDADGNVFGYVQGAITRDMMDSIVRQTVTGVRDAG